MNIQRLVTSNQLSNAIRDLVFPIEIITARSDGINWLAINFIFLGD